MLDDLKCVSVPLHTLCVPIRTALISLTSWTCMWKFRFLFRRMKHLTLTEIDMPHLMCDFWAWYRWVKGIRYTYTARNIWFQNMKFIFSAFQLLISWKLVDLWSMCVLKSVKLVDDSLDWMSRAREFLWSCAVNAISLWAQKVSEMSMRAYDKSHRRCFKRIQIRQQKDECGVRCGSTRWKTFSVKLKSFS